MLSLVSALQEYIKCNKGLYKYSIGSGQYCTDPRDCKTAEGWYAYNATWECMRGYSPGGTRPPAKNDDNSYGCTPGWYLVLKDGVATCVATSAECGSTYLFEDNQVCVDTEALCRETLGGYVYDKEKKLCLTELECTVTMHSYVWENKCLTAWQRPSRAFAYLGTGLYLDKRPE